MLDYIVGFADVFVLIVDAIADFLNTIQSAIPGLDLGIHLPDFFKPLAWYQPTFAVGLGNMH